MYQKVLVPLDGSALAECVLPHVEALSKGCQAQDVVFLSVVEPLRSALSGEGGPALRDEEIARINNQNHNAAREYIHTIAERFKPFNLKVQTVALLNEYPGNASVSETIASYAKKNDIDLIVVASHGRSGVSRWVWGSVTDRVLRSACVPVFMVRAPGCVPGI